MAPRGKYWSKTAESGAKYVWVDYGPGGGSAMDLSEQSYRNAGYYPPIERLPSKDQYERSYELEYAPKGLRDVSFALCSTAKEALALAQSLERSDEEVRRIKAPGGHNIGPEELEIEAKKEGGKT